MNKLDQLIGNLQSKQYDVKFPNPRSIKEKVSEINDVKKVDVIVNDKDIVCSLGLFLKALLVAKRNELSIDQINNIKDSQLYKRVDQISKEFETPEERISHDKIYYNAIYLLKKSVDIQTALNDYYKGYMAGFSKEKRKKTGAVYTPPEIIKWIHDKLEEYSPIDLNKTYWEPACGTGRFVLDWYDRMIKHWSLNVDKYPELGTVEKVHRHIIEQCLHFSDIDLNAVRLCKLGLFLKCPQVKDLKFNETGGQDTLLMEWPKGWPEKMDYVAGNPPYIVTKKSQYPNYRFNDNLYKMFVELAFTKGKDIGMIYPLSWITSPDALDFKHFLRSRLSYCLTISEKTKLFKSITQATSVCMFKEYQQDSCAVLRNCNIKCQEIELDFDEPLLAYCSSESKSVIQKMTLHQKMKDCFLLEGAKFNSTTNKKDIVEGGLPIVKGESLSKKYRLDSSKNAGFLSIENMIKRYGNSKSFLLIKRLGNNGAHNVGSGWLKASYGCDVVPDSNYCFTGPVNNFLLACLNSKCLNYYYSIINDSNTISLPKLNALPIPNYDPRLDPLVDKMILNPDDKETEAEINKIVYELYGLSEEEIKIIETELGDIK